MSTRWDLPLAFVIGNEAEHGRKAVDTRGRGAAGYLVSDDGRVIEVKAYGRSARGSGLWLETRDPPTGADGQAETHPSSRR